jgi:hypothetical protein
MAEESGVVARRRGRQEIARLAALYRVLPASLRDFPFHS